MPVGVANQGPRLGAFIGVQNASGTKSRYPLITPSVVREPRPTKWGLAPRQPPYPLPGDLESFWMASRSSAARS